MTTTQRTDVPGRVIPILDNELNDFSTEAQAFLAGDVVEQKFIGFRLKQGVYGQRQPSRQMIPVKLPSGGVSPDPPEARAAWGGRRLCARGRVPRRPGRGPVPRGWAATGAAGGPWAGTRVQEALG